MAEDDKPSGTLRSLPTSIGDAGAPQVSSEVQKPPARKHKVIADIQSGLVLIAPLDTPPEEDDEPPSGEVDPN